MSVRDGIAHRLLHVEGSPVLVRAWQPAGDRVIFRADALDPASVRGPELIGVPERTPASPAKLELAIERLRFALAVDDDNADFCRRFRRDPLLGPLIRRRPHLRPRRRPWPWEALAWAVTAQLIEAVRAARIQRRIVRRWGPHVGEGRGALRDVPCAAAIAGRAPAELEGMDLAGRRAIAMRMVAAHVAAGRCDPGDPAADAKLLATPNIGPWTVQCLGFHGRGEADSLPAGDLGYVKLIGHLAGLGRRAAPDEVHEFFAGYEPYRGLAGYFALMGLHKIVAKGPPLPAAA
jgi:3-methyladenine DNA glycosylase/8-oxoguanine DNA glycosylase